jgi:hypothetical protein
MSSKKRPFDPADVLPLAKQLFVSIVAIKEAPTDQSILEDLANTAIDASVAFFHTYHRRLDATND